MSKIIESSSKKSNKLIALMSFWGILLVILGHSGFEEPIVAENLRALDTWIYSFHMPLFFFISGYLYSLTNKSFLDIQPGMFLKKKFIRLYIPYIVLGLIVFGIKYGLSGLMGVSREYSIRDFLLMFIAPRWQNSTMGYLWFIVTLFFLFVIITAIGHVRLDLKKPEVALIVILLGWAIRYCLPEQDWIKLFNFYALMWYIPFFIIGIQYQCNEESLTRIVASSSWVKTAILFVITLIGTWLLMESVNTPINYLWKIVFAIVGIVFSMSLCCVLLELKTIRPYVLPFGDITYTIYLMSFFGQYSTKALVVNILHLPWPFWVISMFIGGLVFPLLVYWIYKSTNEFGGNKFLKIVIGA